MRARPAAVGTRECVPVLRIVKRVVQTRDGTAGVAKPGVLCDVAYALAVDIDFPCVLEAGEITRSVEDGVRRGAGLRRDAACGSVCHRKILRVPWPAVVRDPGLESEAFFVQVIDGMTR